MSPTASRMAASCLTALALGAQCALAQAPAPVAYIIDTHAHIQPGGRGGTDVRGSLDGALKRMEQYGFSRIVVMPPPGTAPGPGRYEIDSLGFAREAYGGRILPGGGGGSLGRMVEETAPDAVTEEVKKHFREQAESVAAAGAVVFGEIGLHHLSLRSMGPRHAYERLQPDHPLLLLLADIAAEKGIPIDVHLDLVPEDMPLPDRPLFNPTNPAQLTANVAAFERLLAHNRNTRIVWAHAGTDPLGTRTVQIQRELLSRNPNLFMSLRLSGGAPPPFIALDPERKLKPFWLALLRDFPDRFVVGTDFFHAPWGGSQRGPKEESLANYRDALSQMPPALAEAIAHGNAERIYRLAAP